MGKNQTTAIIVIRYFRVSSPLIFNVPFWRSDKLSSLPCHAAKHRSRFYVSLPSNTLALKPLWAKSIYASFAHWMARQERRRGRLVTYRKLLHDLFCQSVRPSDPFSQQSHPAKQPVWLDTFSWINPESFSYERVFFSSFSSSTSAHQKNSPWIHHQVRLCGMIVNFLRNSHLNERTTMMGGRLPPLPQPVSCTSANMCLE